VSAFVRDRCETGRSHEVGVDDLWGAWRRWCEDDGHKPGNKQTFGRNLRAVVPGLHVAQAREGEKRVRVYYGIHMRPQ
jgi:putative DNA primase/helicase